MKQIRMTDEDWAIRVPADVWPYVDRERESCIQFMIREDAKAGRLLRRLWVEGYRRQRVSDYVTSQIERHVDRRMTDHLAYAVY